MGHKALWHWLTVRQKALPAFPHINGLVAQGVGMPCSMAIPHTATLVGMVRAKENIHHLMNVQK